MNGEWSLDVLYKGYDDPKFAEDRTAFDAACARYCAAASPSAHRVPLGDSRRFSARPHRSPLSLGRFAMTLHGRVTQLR